ncbi:MAG: YihY/virulence factor BrkB family protein [Acidimicrobiales bacterium]
MASAGNGPLSRLDAFQRQHRWLGFPLAVTYKFFEDQGNFLAALIAFYGFISLFFLLVILVTILDLVVGSNSGLHKELLSSALANFPIIGTQISNNVHALRGSFVTLGVSAAVCIHGGLEVVQAAQKAFNRIWAVPRLDRPNPLTSRLRSGVLLITLGLGVLVTTSLSGFSIDTTGTLNELTRIATTAGSFLLNVAIFALAYRWLSAIDLSTRQVLPGAILAGACWQALQTLGTYYVAHALNGVDALAGVFGVVLGLLAWIYLEAVITVICAEINVVHVRRLWPRGLATLFTDTTDLTPADRKVYESYSQIERYKSFQRVTVEFEAPATPAEPAEPGEPVDAPATPAEPPLSPPPTPPEPPGPRPTTQEGPPRARRG